MTEQQAPQGLPAPAQSSTWDDWIMMRALPEPPPGDGPRGVEISKADLLAEQLRWGLWHMLDLSDQYVRDAFRDLFAEFEKDTAGQVMTHKDLNAASHVQMLYKSLQVQPADGKVAMTITDGVGVAREIRLEPEHALSVAQLLIDALHGLGIDGPD